MSFQLTHEEYKLLRVQQNVAGLTKRRYRKVTVLIMRHQGHSAAVIEAALGLDDNTIYRYEQAYRKLGLTRFLDDNYVAYAGRLTEEQEQALGAHLDEFLYPDAKSIAAYVYAQYGVQYSVEGMTALLRRLGFVYKKSKAVAAKADETAQCTFVQEQLPALLEEVDRGEAVVYFADGCHPTHNTKTSRGWVRRGQDFVIDCNSGRKRLNINAAINALKPEHLVYELSDSINAQSTQRLCRQLLKKHPGRSKIYLVCDNARYNRNEFLTTWAAGQRIELVYLPTYSPNLNLIERLWHFMRVKILNSTYYEKYAEFRAAVVSFLTGIKRYKQELRRLLTLNFHTVGGTSVHLSQTT